MRKSSLEQKLRLEIPVTKHMNFQIQKLNDSECLLKAKLKENVNHKGTAFGGSQFSLCAVSAYAFIYNWLSKQDIQTDNIVIAEGNIRYRLPVDQDFHIQAKMTSEPVFQKGSGEKSARIIFPMACLISIKNKKCAEFTARFIVFCNNSDLAPALQFKKTKTK